MSFNETEHPRAADGQFAEKTGAAPELTLAPEKRPVMVSDGDDDRIAFTRPDGEEVEVEHGARLYAGHIDPAVHQNDDGTFDVLYATYDDEPSDYEFMEGDSLEGFTSAYDRDEYVQAKLSEGIKPENIFVVEKYEHGSSRYSPLADWTEWVADQRSEHSRLSDQWDSAPSHIYVAGESANPKEQATSIMEDYTMFANGEVYVVHRITVDADGEETERESVHGFIGTEHAEESINGGEV